MKLLSILRGIELEGQCCFNKSASSWRVSRVILVGVVFGVIAAIVGLYLSYQFNLPSGPSIALTSTAIFVLEFLKRVKTSGVAGSA